MTNEEMGLKQLFSKSLRMLEKVNQPLLVTLQAIQVQSFNSYSLSLQTMPKFFINKADRVVVVSYKRTTSFSEITFLLLT